jgi:hypothetical protein
MNPSPSASKLNRMESLYIDSDNGASNQYQIKQKDPNSETKEQIRRIVDVISKSHHLTERDIGFS